MSSLISSLGSIVQLGRAESSIEYSIATFLAVVLVLIGAYFVIIKKQIKKGLILASSGAIVYGFSRIKNYFIQKSPTLAAEEGLRYLI